MCTCGYLCLYACVCVYHYPCSQFYFQCTFINQPFDPFCSICGSQAVAPRLSQNLPRPPPRRPAQELLEVKIDSSVAVAGIPVVPQPYVQDNGPLAQLLESIDSDSAYNSAQQRPFYNSSQVLHIPEDSDASVESSQDGRTSFEVPAPNMILQDLSDAATQGKGAASAEDTIKCVVEVMASGSQYEDDAHLLLLTQTKSSNEDVQSKAELDLQEINRDSSEPAVLTAAADEVPAPLLEQPVTIALLSAQSSKLSTSVPSSVNPFAPRLVLSSPSVSSVIASSPLASFSPTTPLAVANQSSIARGYSEDLQSSPLALPLVSATLAPLTLLVRDEEGDLVRIVLPGDQRTIAMLRMLLAQELDCDVSDISKIYDVSMGEDAPVVLKADRSSECRLISFFVDQPINCV
jgi:hypothetical protein